MKKKTRLLVLILSALLSHLDVSADQKTKSLNSKDVQTLLPCAPPLISQWVQEMGFAKEVRVHYGVYEFRRTDVGEPDGKLKVFEGKREICSVDLSLNPKIYFSGIEKIMVVSGYSGSNNWFDFYRLKSSRCVFVGQTADDTVLNATKSLLSENDGKRICRTSPATSLKE